MCPLMSLILRSLFEIRKYKTLSGLDLRNLKYILIKIKPINFLWTLYYGFVWLILLHFTVFSLFLKTSLWALQVWLLDQNRSNIFINFRAYYWNLFIKKVKIKNTKIYYFFYFINTQKAVTLNFFNLTIKSAIVQI